MDTHIVQEKEINHILPVIRDSNLITSPIIPNANQSTKMKNLRIGDYYTFSVLTDNVVTKPVTI